MQNRKITIVETKNQKKSVIMSAATTLSELKADLRQNGIDYTGMTFFEGTSKVELKNDNSVLPHDVPYKGTITNELVFMLTNTNKKIRSGAMSRAEAFNIIKYNQELKEDCKKIYNKDYTHCTTIELITLLEDYNSYTNQEVEKPTPVSKAPKSEKSEDTNEVVDVKARAAISKLVQALYENNTIYPIDRDKVMNILGGKVEVDPSEDRSLSKCPYSDDEIDDMFSEMNVD
nr:MAG TPA: hypothetical protein [Crassvirales sp.]